MKQLLTSAIFFVLLIAANNASGYIEEIEQGYETSALRVTLTGPESGRVVVKECDSCSEMELEITADTKVYKSNSVVPLARVERFRGQEGVVFRDIKSKRVTRIKIY